MSPERERMNMTTDPLTGVNTKARLTMGLIGSTAKNAMPTHGCLPLFRTLARSTAHLVPYAWIMKDNPQEQAGNTVGVKSKFSTSVTTTHVI